ILERDSEGQVVARMRNEAELRLPRPDQPRLVVGVHVLRIKNVARQWRQALAIRSCKTPILSSQDFESVFLPVYKHVAHTECIRVAGDENVPAVFPQKVSFEVAENFPS